MKISKYILLFFILINVSCDYLPFKKKNEESKTEELKPVARVKDKFLYTKDLVGIFPDEISEADSLNRLEQFVKSWIQKQLVISEAQEQLEFNEVELERKVLDYRYALIIHEFEKQFVNRKLNTVVTEKEIQEYYDNNIDNFELKQNIVQCNFVQLPKNAARINRFRTLLRNSRERDQEEIREYCYQYANKAHLEDSLWINFEEVIVNTPLSTIPNKTQYLRRNKFVEVQDDDFIYFLKILDYKITNDTSPLEFVRDDIEKIIINKRKVALAKTLEKEIYERAVENEQFETYY
ncbi:MAG TPA: hypothetical protein DDY13_09715 [Cytophagales bacterium]|nr:hypothetical protein [Cytophagales bacterium]